MSLNTRRLLNSAAALAVTAFSLASTPASAESAKLKSMSFDLQSANTTIHVVSTDGQKWDKLKAGNAQFWGHMKIDTKWPGFVDEVAVVLGTCSAGQCGLRPLLWSTGVGKRDYTTVVLPRAALRALAGGIRHLDAGRAAQAPAIFVGLLVTVAGYAMLHPRATSRTAAAGIGAVTVCSVAGALWTASQSVTG